MLRPSRIMIAAATFLSVVGIGAALRSRSGGAARHGSASSPEVAESAGSEARARAERGAADGLHEQRIARVEDGIDAVRAELEAARRERVATAAASPDAGAQTEPTDPRMPAEAAAETAQLFELQLKSERADPEFRRESETLVRTFFHRPELTGSSVAGLECGTTICRVDVKSTGIEARGAFFDEVSAMLPPDSNAFVHVEDENDLAVEVYFSHAGQTLPKMEM